MIREGRLKVVLCALTGFGNTVLEALIGDPRVDVRAVCTVRYGKPCPYYEEQQLVDLCAARGVTCHPDVKVSGEEGTGLLRRLSPDLMVVATFKEILKGEVFSIPSLGIVNFHPSLLPSYRGPCPTHAVLLNDEPRTGVTVHYLREAVDAGEILLQRALVIDDADNDGRLRQKLARLAGEMLPDLVGMFSGFKSPPGVPQTPGIAASRAPRPVAEDGYLERAPGVNEIRRRIRAFNPYPGTSIEVGGRRVPVERFEVVRDERAPGLYESLTTVEVVGRDGSIRLFKKRDG